MGNAFHGGGQSTDGWWSSDVVQWSATGGPHPAPQLFFSEFVDVLGSAAAQKKAWVPKSSLKFPTAGLFFPPVNSVDAWVGGSALVCHGPCNLLSPGLTRQRPTCCMRPEL